MLVVVPVVFRRRKELEVRVYVARVAVEVGLLGNESVCLCAWMSLYLVTGSTTVANSL